MLGLRTCILMCWNSFPNHDIVSDVLFGGLFIMLIKLLVFLIYLQAAARWWNTHGLGSAFIFLHPLLTRLALPKYNAHLLVPLRSCICDCPCTHPFWNWFQGTLSDTLPSLCSPDVQILHLHQRCICKAACKTIFGYHIHGKSLLAFWLLVLQQHFSVVLQSRGTCFMAYLDGVQFIFCKHIPDVRAQQLGWNPKVAHFMGFFPYVTIRKPKTQWQALQSKWRPPFPLRLEADIWFWKINRAHSNTILFSFNFLDGCKW